MQKHHLYQSGCFCTWQAVHEPAHGSPKVALRKGEHALAFCPTSRATAVISHYDRPCLAATSFFKQVPIASPTPTLMPRPALQPWTMHTVTAAQSAWVAGRRGALYAVTHKPVVLLPNANHAATYNQMAPNIARGDCLAPPLAAPAVSGTAEGSREAAESSPSRSAGSGAAGVPWVADVEGQKQVQAALNASTAQKAAHVIAAFLATHYLPSPTAATAEPIMAAAAAQQPSTSEPSTQTVLPSTAPPGTVPPHAAVQQQYASAVHVLSSAVVSTVRLMEPYAHATGAGSLARAWAQAAGRELGPAVSNSPSSGSHTVNILQDVASELMGLLPLAALATNGSAAAAAEPAGPAAEVGAASSSISSLDVEDTAERNLAAPASATPTAAASAKSSSSKPSAAPPPIPNPGLGAAPSAHAAAGSISDVPSNGEGRSMSTSEEEAWGRMSVPPMSGLPRSTPAASLPGFPSLSSPSGPHLPSHTPLTPAALGGLSASPVFVSPSVGVPSAFPAPKAGQGMGSGTGPVPPPNPAVAAWATGPLSWSVPLVPPGMLQAAEQEAAEAQAAVLLHAVRAAGLLPVEALARVHIVAEVHPALDGLLYAQPSVRAVPGPGGGVHAQLCVHAFLHFPALDRPPAGAPAGVCRRQQGCRAVWSARVAVHVAVHAVASWIACGDCVTRNACMCICGVVLCYR